MSLRSCSPFVFDAPPTSIHLRIRTCAQTANRKIKQSRTSGPGGISIGLGNRAKKDAASSRVFLNTFSAIAEVSGWRETAQAHDIRLAVGDPRELSDEDLMRIIE